MPRTYYISRRKLATLKRSAERADIHELCYLVFGRGARIMRLIRVPNRAEDSVMHHVFAARDVCKVRLRESLKQYSLLGYLHTHILSDAYPSQGDVEGYPNGTLIFIYADHCNELRAFRTADESRGYIEKCVRII